MEYIYSVRSFYNEARATLETNDVRIAIGEFLEYVEDGVTCDVINNLTGEVLAIANNPDNEDYATEEMALMVLGFLTEEADPIHEETECLSAEDIVLKMIQAMGGLPS